MGELAARWQLRLEPPYPQLSYNYAAPGVDAAGQPIVLKVCYPSPEYATEVAALRLFNGYGAVRLYDAAAEANALLLEQARPGTALSAMTDDEAATARAAEVMRRIRRQAPAEPTFPTVASWMSNMDRRRPALLEAGTPEGRWIARSLALYADLVKEDSEEVLLHGDLHQGNIVAAEREPWLAIDPKGVVGPPVWETGPLLLNVLPEPVDSPEGRRVLLRRADQLADDLGYDRELLRAWGAVRAVLSGFWSLEDEGAFNGAALRIADALVP